MERVVCLFLAAILQLLLQKSCVTGQEIPKLPEYFSAYLDNQYFLKDTGRFVMTAAKDYFDGTVELSRSDVAAESFYPGAIGMMSIITDPVHKVQYLIQRETRNCSVIPLTIPYGGGGIVIGPDGSYHFGGLNNLFYLVNASKYTYVGNFTAHGGFVLDNWTYTGEFEVPNVTYSDATIDLSIARTAVSTQGLDMGPVPWRIAINGNMSVNDGMFTDFISSVLRISDLSFIEPHYDVFDVSICSEPKDNLVLTMAVPKDMNKVDYSSFRKNVRLAIVSFTEVLPIQVGAIEIIKDNGTALFTTVQISNLTTLANVPNAVTALAAMNKINNGIVDGSLPFQIEIGSGVMVTPQLVIVLVEPETPIPTTMPTNPSSTNPMPMPTSATVTVTVTPSNCPTMPVSSVFVCPTSTPSPAPLGKTYSQSYVVGLAFGMIILGAAVAILSIFVGIFVFSRCKNVSMRTGYERHVNPT